MKPFTVQLTSSNTISDKYSPLRRVLTLTRIRDWRMWFLWEIRYAPWSVVFGNVNYLYTTVLIEWECTWESCCICDNTSCNRLWIIKTIKNNPEKLNIFNSHPPLKFRPLAILLRISFSLLFSPMWTRLYRHMCLSIAPSPRPWERSVPKLGIGTIYSYPRRIMT